MADDGGELPILVELVDDTSDGRSRLGRAFRTWARDDDMRVLFTPGVLVAVSSSSARGYLHDDGWTVECWIERGVRRVGESLEDAFGSVAGSYAVGDAGDANGCTELLELAIEKGDPIDDFRHLI